MLLLTEGLIAVLLTYLCWYVSVFGNYTLILYGATAASALCVGIRMLYYKEFDFAKYPKAVWLHFILAVYLMGTSILVAVYRSEAISATITFLSYGVVCFVIAYISIEKQSIDWLINIIIFITFLTCYWVTFRGIYKIGYGNILSKYNNPNVLGLMMVLGIFALAFKAGKYRKLLFVFVVLSLWPLYIILGCGSRKSLLAALLFYGIWLVMMTRDVYQTSYSITKIIYTLGMVVVAYFAFRYFRNWYAMTDMAERMSHFSEESSNNYRIYLYQEAFNQFLDHPVLGIGIEQFRYYSIGAHMAHSTYAEAIADFGLVGTVIYFTPIVGAIADIIRKAINKEFDYSCSIIFALIITELFLGVGQVFFYQAEHFLAWSVIYCFLQIHVLQDTDKEDELLHENKQHKCKYIREDV